LNTPQNILILGGSGFLSGTIARLAAELGHHVTIVTRGNKPIPQGVTALQVDRSDRAAFAKLIQQQKTTWDLVVDAIAFNPEDAQQDVEVFAGQTKRFVLVSTDFVYDPNHRNIPQTETDAHYTTEGYGGKKRQAELILEQADTAMLPWTVLRPSHIFGPGSLFGCIPLCSRDPQLIEDICQHKPLTLVEGGRLLQHPIYAPDLAMTILSAMTDQKSVGKILNIAGPDHFESHVYYSTLGKLLDRDVTIESISAADFLADHPDKAPFCCDRIYDLTALEQTDLSIPKTSLEEGLKQMLVSISKPFNPNASGC
tara:strand:- start:4298 stop:5233 length:936 start_codon:yes stop_codon:yes gene_type:complete